MQKQSYNRFMKLPSGQKKGWIAVWCLILVACLAFSYLTVLAARDASGFSRRAYLVDPGGKTTPLGPGQTLGQQFTAAGASAGSLKDLCMELVWDRGEPVPLEFRLIRDSDGAVLRQEELLADGTDFHAGTHVKAKARYACGVEINEEVSLISGESYTLELKNLDDKTPVRLAYNPSACTGSLTLDGEEIPGFLNIRLTRGTLYQPDSRMVAVLIAVTVVTVLLGTALVLFSRVRVQLLYLLLAVGFGAVMLFDLTPLYGFDIRFQFDSAYVVSDQMMGLGGVRELPSLTDPDQTSVFYQRRAGDDYSQYQFYRDQNVSANYTENRQGLARWKASPEEQELVLAEAWQGEVGEQLYLYIPHALGFTLARLLGLGFYPMLLLARIFAYALLVLTVYKAISRAPVGKHLLLLFGLLPTVMVQSLSISRDTTIFIMAFYLIGKVLQGAYGEKAPSVRDWICILGVSVLLAPCKMIYLPVSFLWLLIVYRRYILPGNLPWGKVLGGVVLASLPILIFFVATNLASIGSLSQAEKASITSDPSRTLSVILSDPGQAAYIFLNTVRTELGEYFLNALQLYNIDLGASHTVSLVFAGLLCLAVCESGTLEFRPLERGFLLLVFLGVFLLTALASMQWTSINSPVILGFQGRYLTPALPLLFLAAGNTRSVTVSEEFRARLVGLGCSILPAIVLMNMYLWTKVH